MSDTTSTDAAHRRAVAERLEQGKRDSFCLVQGACAALEPNPAKWCDDCALREAARLLDQLLDSNTSSSADTDYEDY